jgi:ABC-type oligopeptide transport system ATPase subunit
MDKKQRQEKVLAMLQSVGLSQEHYGRYPHELSGGQVQRLGIAIALMPGPKLVVCDEPVSALDVSIQAQILNMLNERKKEMGLSLLFISHDMGVIRYMSDRIGVMHKGKLVEERVNG